MNHAPLPLLLLLNFSLSLHFSFFDHVQQLGWQLLVLHCRWGRPGDRQRAGIQQETRSTGRTLRSKGAENCETNTADEASSDELLVAEADGG